MSLCSESRSLITFLPLVILCCVKALDTRRGVPLAWLPVVVLSLAFSNVWLTINTGAFTSDALRFPDQKLFMTCGPWMSFEMYVIETVAVLAACLLLAWSAAAERRAVAPNRSKETP